MKKAMIKMKLNNKIIYIIWAFIGAVIFYLGFIFPNKQVSGMCIGLGAAFFCLGLGNFISKIIVKKIETEDIIRRKNIEVNDERNIRIREKAGAKTNQFMIYALSVLVLALGFMNAGIIIILMVSALLILQLIFSVYFSNYYSKRM